MLWRDISFTSQFLINYDNNNVEDLWERIKIKLKVLHPFDDGGGDKFYTSYKHNVPCQRQIRSA